jgi:lysophospholipid acyltransferase (LPLAT)-like uncharacterized protein
MAASPHRSVVVAIWHQHFLAMLPGLPKGWQWAIMASRSADGDITSGFAQRLGLRAYRGSSRKGGAHAAHEALRGLEEGWSLILTVDGPRGPFRVPKPGALALAARAGVPVVPVAGRATSDVVLPSWDRLRVPLPGAQVAVVFGAALTPIPSADAAGELAQRRHLAEVLNQLEVEAAGHCRRRDATPPWHRLRDGQRLR